MKNYMFIILCSCKIAVFAQNVGIGTTTPTEALTVTKNANSDKNVIYGTANQTSSFSDYQNTGVAGFGEGNGVVNGFGYGFGVKGIGSFNGYGAVGVYAGLGTSIPTVSLLNNYYALYADVRNPAPNRYAGIFLNGNVGVGTTSPSYILDVADRIRLRSGPSGSAGLWLNKTDNTSPAGFMGNFDDNHIGLYGNNGAAWSLLMNTATGNVGIGNSSPANKLDVNGNLNFTGVLKLNGSSGTAGQIVQSNGAGAPTWSNKPYSFVMNGTGGALSGSTLCTTIAGIDGQAISLSQNATITYQFTTPLYGNNGTFGGNSKGAVAIEILNGSGSRVSLGNSQFNVPNLIASQIIVVGFADLTAGNYTIRARIVRSLSGDGDVSTNGGQVGFSAGCNDIPIPSAQMIVQVFPK